MSIRTLHFLLSVSTSLRFFIETSVSTSSLASPNPSDFSIMSSTLTSGAVSESLDATSLSTHAIIVGDHRDNTSTAKDGQHASQSLGDRPATGGHRDDTSIAKDGQDARQSSGDRPATEDHPNDISTASNGHDANHSSGEPSKDGSTPGYRPPLIQEDTDFCAAVLFCKQFLEMEKTQGSRNQESKPLLSRISGALPSFNFYSVSDTIGRFLESKHSPG